MFTLYTTGMLNALDYWVYICNNYNAISARYNHSTDFWELKFKI